MKSQSNIQSLTRHKNSTGHVPGTMMFHGKQKVEKSTIEVLSYNADVFEKKVLNSVDECSAYMESNTVNWINIIGIHDTHIVEQIGKQFNLHPLLLEDVLNTTQRPKIDVYDTHLFIVLHTMQTEEDLTIHNEQISIVTGKGWVITFCESKQQAFEHVINAIEKSKGKIRSMQSDYLAYSILDTIIDHYFSVFDTIGETLETMEIDLIERPNANTLHTIYHVKRDMIFIRKAIWPLREVVSFLMREQSPLIHESTHRYLQDLYDHTIQIIDIVDSYRDILSGMLDNYLSSMSNHMNAIMKVLTMFTAIFIPLTFIAGLYGMNFKYMPEIYWKYGYGFAWTLMIILTCTMLFYFRKKKWL